MARILEDEIANDPLFFDYASMDDVTLLASLNVKIRTRNITNLSPGVVFNGIDQTEWDALTDANRTRIMNLLRALGEINLFGRELEDFKTVFGTGSVTASNLTALRVENISRGVEIGWGVVKEKDLRMHTITRA